MEKTCLSAGVETDSVGQTNHTVTILAVEVCFGGAGELVTSEVRRGLSSESDLVSLEGKHGNGDGSQSLGRTSVRDLCRIP